MECRMLTLVWVHSSVQFNKIYKKDMLCGCCIPLHYMQHDRYQLLFKLCTTNYSDYTFNILNANNTAFIIWETTASTSNQHPSAKAHWHKEAPPLNQQFGLVLFKRSKGNQYNLWTIVTYCNMMSVRTRQGSNAIKKIEDLQLNNKKKNDEICKQREEEEK